ncbi:MAG: hypothetical protein HQL31_14380 [Planctomycetes bacterium]|nr:hypothetical protein [Planctomycetota bacterium]
MIIGAIDDVVAIEGVVDQDIGAAEHILGNIVINGAITPLMDLRMIVRRHLLNEPSGKKSEYVLLWEKSTGLREERARLLRNSGYDVIEASTSEDVNEVFRYREVDVVVTDSETSSTETETMVDNIRSNLGREFRAPIIEITENADDNQQSPYQKRLSSEQLLDGIRELLHS